MISGAAAGGEGSQDEREREDSPPQDKSVEALTSGLSLRAPSGLSLRAPSGLSLRAPCELNQVVKEREQSLARELNPVAKEREQSLARELNPVVKEREQSLARELSLRAPSEIRER